MSTIAIAELKAHLSAEIKRVRDGETLVILDHRQPVAQMTPLPGRLRLSRQSKRKPEYEPLTPLMAKDPLIALDAERDDSW